jgi:hypothetical protein
MEPNASQKGAKDSKQDKPSPELPATKDVFEMIETLHVDVETVFQPSANPEELLDDSDIELDAFKRFCNFEVPETRPKLQINLKLTK